MSLYDDVVITETGFTAPGANESSNGTSTTNKANESSSDIAGWNNSLKLLQHQVEAAKKRQQSTLNALVNQKREKQQTIAPVIDLTEKKKPQLQLRKEPEFISNRNSYSEIRFNALTGKVEKEEVGSIFGTLNEEYDPMRPNDYEKLTFELRRLKQAQEEDARRAEREKRRKREEEEREKRRERERERRRRRRRSSAGSRSRSRSRSGSRSSGEDRSSKHRRHDSDEQKKKNSLFAPPPSLVADVEATSSRDSSDDAATPRPTKSLFGGLMKVEKMMVKMGYKEGEGLGKNNQGMSMALLVEKTGARSGRIIHEKDLPEIPFSMVPSPLHPSLAPPLAPPLPPPPPVAAPAAASTSGATKEAVGVPSDVMKNMSKCVLLRNMVGPGDVDDELETETKEECQKYGEVNKVIIFEMPDKPPDEAVRIFIEFKTLPSAIKALTDLNGRFFGGRAVRASFYDLDKFQRLQLQEPV